MKEKQENLFHRRNKRSSKSSVKYLQALCNGHDTRRIGYRDEETPSSKAAKEK
jgi:hypothetical protein